MARYPMRDGRPKSLGEKIVDRAVAEVAYIALVIVSIVETIFVTCTWLVYRVTERGEQANLMFARLKSSSFSILWSAVCVVVNPFKDKLIITETEARKLLKCPRVTVQF
ncbi:MAG: hypothetical protein HY069_02950 [Chlamydiia bacterium]|nr:hypothetical protein [Chlamydiia bacterium]